MKTSMTSVISQRTSSFRHLNRPASAQEDQQQSGELHKVVEGVVCEIVGVHGDLHLLNDGGNERQYDAAHAGEG